MAAAADAMTAPGVLDILFDRMPMGLAILDRECRFMRCNPTFAEFTVRGTRRTPAEVVPGACVFDIDPDIEPAVRPLLERALAGETVRLDGAALRTRDPHWYWDLVFAPLASADGPQVLAVATDVTERAHAQQLLERLVEERTRELAARQRTAEGMRGVLMALNSGRGLQDVLDYVVEQATRLLGAGAAALFRLERNGTWIRLEAARGLPVDYGSLTEGSVASSPVAQMVIADRRPLGLPDLPSQIAAGAGTMTADQRRLGEFIARTFRSALVAPLIVKDDLYGGMVLYYSDRREVSDEDLARATAFCNHAALAIENSRLREAAEQRLRELEALYQADEQLHRSLRLDHVLQALVDVAARILHPGTATVLVWDETQERLAPGASRGPEAPAEAVTQPDATGPVDSPQPPDAVSQAAAAGQTDAGAEAAAPGQTDAGAEADAVGQADHASHAHAGGQADAAEHAANERLAALVAATGESLVLEDVAANPGAMRAAGVASLMYVPITVNGQVFGVFGVTYRERRALPASDLRLLQALGQRAALAIENARLYEQAHQMAADRERQRLARDLHDSVTQTLFSATLIAEVLPSLWERNPVEGYRRLEELRQLSRGALAEMRTLLFELRPAALAAVPLPDLLSQLVEAANGRARLPIALDTAVDAPLPGEVHLALYRIAQEALNNVARHASASHAAVTLQVRPTRAELRIEDDGQGFSPDRVDGGHLGLSIMRERAQAIGANLHVRSTPGAGTRVTVAWRPSR